MSGFAPKKLSLTLGAKKPTSGSSTPLSHSGGGVFAAKPKPLNGVKRPRASALGGDSDDEDEGANGAHQEITAFDSAVGGAVAKEGRRDEGRKMVIEVKPNSDRLEYGRRSKKQRNDLPAENDADIVIEKKKVAFGLTVMEKTADELQNGEQQPATGESAASEPEKPRTEDEAALAALTGNAHSTRTIAIPDEDEAFARDMDGAQAAPTLEEYLAVPVSEFGAAALRGMGWKDTDTIGKSNGGGPALKPRVLERRPALLGIGAKPAAAVGVELGEWGKAAKRGKEKQAYNPVVMRNKVTGEMLTEEELQAKLKTQENGAQDGSMMFDEDKPREERRDRERHRDRDDERSSRRDRDDRERRKEPERIRDRDRGDGDRGDDRDRRRDGDSRRDRDRRDRDRDRSGRDRDRDRRRRDDNSDDESERRRERHRRRSRSRSSSSEEDRHRSSRRRDERGGGSGRERRDRDRDSDRHGHGRRR